MQFYHYTIILFDSSIFIIFIVLLKNILLLKFFSCIILLPKNIMFFYNIFKKFLLFIISIFINTMLKIFISIKYPFMLKILLLLKLVILSNCSARLPSMDIYVHGFNLERYDSKPLELTIIDSIQSGDEILVLFANIQSESIDLNNLPRPVTYIIGYLSNQYPSNNESFSLYVTIYNKYIENGYFVIPERDMPIHGIYGLKPDMSENDYFGYDELMLLLIQLMNVPQTNTSLFDSAIKLIVKNTIFRNNPNNYPLEYFIIDAKNIYKIMLPMFLNINRH